jgi:hypothetical protein
MPIATTPTKKTELPNDATPTAVATHQEAAQGVGGKPREPQPADAADDPYDNVACTD